MGISLRGRVGFGIGMLILVSLAIAAIGVSGATRMHQDFGAAIVGYQQLRDVYEIGFHAAQARKLLEVGPERLPDARHEVEAALTRLELAGGSQRQSSIPGRGWLADSRASMRVLHTDLQTAQAELERGASSPALDAAIARVATIAMQVGKVIEDRRDAAESARRQTAWTIAAASGWLILTAALIGIRQYRSVTRPVLQLGDAVRRFAAGDLNTRVKIEGDREFVELASDFNRMAGELSGFQHELEEKVATKSRELVRSERLATVGYMAAGVAHEINNPLGIIAAYAERALLQMRRAASGDEGKLEGGLKALEVISEEAFRCKAITDRLLTLSRPGNAERAPVSLRALAQDVINTLRGLPQWRSVDLILEGKGNDSYIATVHDGEIKQVLLNLLVNALEAVPETNARVVVTLERDAAHLKLVVEDNGRGIEAQSLEHVFEPFFTRKRPTAGARAGTGLGLSVCQAIVDAHGGRIFAESGGAGWGSRFVVLLPVVPPVAVQKVEITNA